MLLDRGQPLSHLHACMLSRFTQVQLFVTLWTVTHQAPLTMGLSRQAYWRSLPFPIPGNRTEGSNPRLLCLLHWEAGSLPLRPLGSLLTTVTIPAWQWESPPLDIPAHRHMERPTMAWWCTNHVDGNVDKLAHIKPWFLDWVVGTLPCLSFSCRKYLRATVFLKVQLLLEAGTSYKPRLEIRNVSTGLLTNAPLVVRPGMWTQGGWFRPLNHKWMRSLEVPTAPPHGFPFVVTVTSESLSVGPPGSFTPSRLSAPEGGWGQVLAAEEPPLPSSSQQQRFSAAPGLAALQACGWQAPRWWGLSQPILLSLTFWCF